MKKMIGMGMGMGMEMRMMVMQCDGAGEKYNVLNFNLPMILNNDAFKLFLLFMKFFLAFDHDVLDDGEKLL